MSVVRVEGLDDLRKVLRRLGDKELTTALRVANKSAAELIVDKALPNVPVRSGRLRRSVRALASQKDARVVAGRATVPYAAAVHWGRKRGNVGSPPGNRIGKNRIAARPFLWDAVERHQAAAVDVYEREVRLVIDKAGLR